MAATATDDNMGEELLEYDGDNDDGTGADLGGSATRAGDAGDGSSKAKGTYVSIHSSTFKDFLLKEELLRAIADCGFEHPSEG